MATLALLSWALVAFFAGALVGTLVERALCRRSIRRAVQQRTRGGDQDA